MTLSPAHEAAPRGQQRQARGQGETTIEVAFNGFASGNAATFSETDERLRALIARKVEAFNAQRSALARGDHAAFIAAGRDLGGIEAEIQLLLPTDRAERGEINRELHRQFIQTRERIRRTIYTNAARQSAISSRGHDAPGQLEGR